MSKRGPKGSHRQLVDAAAAAQDQPTAAGCGGRTKSGGACKKPAGQGTEHPGVGQCRHHDGQVEVGSPCPLPLTKLEEQIWNDLSVRLRELRLFKPAFWPTLYGLVIALATLHDAREELDAIAVPGRGASVKKHPAAIVANQMLYQVRAYLQELGLTPSALAKIGPPDDDGPLTKMERLIRGRGR